MNLRMANGRELYVHGGICGFEDEDMKNYIEFNCPECGAPLEVWSEETIEGIAKLQSCNYQHEARFLIRHCNNCHCDWENIWCIEEGETSETPLMRKFWG